MTEFATVPEGAVIPSSFPTWITWGVRRGGKFTFLPKDGATSFCGWCRGQCPPRRSSYCSPECVALASWAWSWRNLRLYIIERDKCCQSCGSDFPGWQHRDRSREPKYRSALYLNSNGLDGPVCWLSPCTWEVDHIMPVSLGGTDDPANLRLLCSGCHRTATVALKSFLAKSARIKKRLPVTASWMVVDV